MCRPSRQSCMHYHGYHIIQRHACIDSTITTPTRTLTTKHRDHHNSSRLFIQCQEHHLQCHHSAPPKSATAPPPQSPSSTTTQTSHSDPTAVTHQALSPAHHQPVHDPANQTRDEVAKPCRVLHQAPHHGRAQPEQYCERCEPARAGYRRLTCAAMAAR